MAEQDKPQFKHDCDGCTFLGRHEDEGRPYDLYHCGQGGRLPTIIARYGDDGPDYASGMVFGREGTVPVLAEAYKRAVARGLKTEPGL